MASSGLNRKLSVQEKKDLDKFTKFLTYKVVQIIVQSRLGEKISTKSKAQPGSDWFNLAIRDLPEVNSEVKKVLSGQLPSVGGPSLCVEISLKTVEQESMVLETWALSMHDQADPASRVTYEVYNRMTVLLKSLLTVTRLTPAHKLSRRQGPDMFVICYRLYLDRPQLHVLGGEQRTVKVGQVLSPVGGVALAVTFRTQLATASQPGDIRLLDDHFQHDHSPKRTPARPCQIGLRMDQRRHSGNSEYSDSPGVCDVMFSASPASDLGTGIGIMAGAGQRLSGSSLGSGTGGVTSPTHDRGARLNQPDTQQEDLEDIHTVKVAAFAQDFHADNSKEGSENIAAQPEIPFSNLLRFQDKENVQERQSEVCVAGVSHDDTITDRQPQQQHRDFSTTSPCPIDPEEDFVMVELKPPFAATDVNTDLGHFYKECQSAPPLALFSQQPTFADTIHSVPEQIEVFEKHVSEFDDFVRDLAVDDSSQ